MAKSKLSDKSIEFRPANPEDAEVVGRLLLATFPKKATFIIGLGSEKRAQEILTRLFSIAGHRLSYDLAEVAIFNQKVVGISIAFPGRMMGKLNRKLYGLILRQYPLGRKFALIRRALPLLFIKETARDELFLSNLAVRKRDRGHGFGERMLAQVELRARALNLHQVGLMCAIDNRDARRFYERHGYTIMAMHLESNQRVRYLGSGTQRMVKELD
jgi:ribosomal protein S18 acetylase RimI-like enzyme